MPKSTSWIKDQIQWKTLSSPHFLSTKMTSEQLSSDDSLWLVLDAVDLTFKDLLSSLKDKWGVHLTKDQSAMINGELLSQAFETYLSSLITVMEMQGINRDQGDSSISVGYLPMEVETRGLLTEEVKEKDIHIFFIDIPAVKDVSGNNISSKITGGMYIPALNVVLIDVSGSSNPDSLYHEVLHVLHKECRTVLEDIMYGNSELSQYEEIITHFHADNTTRLLATKQFVDGMTFNRATNGSISSVTSKSTNVIKDSGNLGDTVKSGKTITKKVNSKPFDRCRMSKRGSSVINRQRDGIYGLSDVSYDHIFEAYNLPSYNNTARIKLANDRIRKIRKLGGK